jgi:hypothetical protein
MTLERKMKCLSLCCLLFCAIACSGPSSGAGNANVAGVGGKPAVAASDSPLDAITKAIHAQFGVKSYRVRMTTTLSDGNTHSRLVEFVAPDRFHMVSDKDETIIVGSSTYMKRASGPWMKSPVDVGSMISAFRDPKMEEELRQSTEVKLIGPDTLDGMPMLVYQYTMTKAMGMDLKSVTKTWVSVVDSLPRKSETEGEFKGIKSNTTNLYYDYNADIKIESPM